MSTFQQLTTIFVIFSLLGIVSVGAVTNGFVDDAPAGQDLVAEVIEGPAFDTLHGVRSHEVEIQRLGRAEPKTSTTREEVWIRLPDQLRTEVLTSTSSVESKGDITVQNGTTLKVYKSDAERMLVETGWEGSVENFDTNRIGDEYEAEYKRTETIAGRETHVVEIEPRRNASVQAALTVHIGPEDFDVITVQSRAGNRTNVSYVTTWWVDAETGYPLKEVVEYEIENPEEHPANTESKTWTTVYENVTYDVEIADERFTLNPPEGTEIYETADSLGVDTIDEANESAPFTVSEPDVPERFELLHVSGYVFDDNVTVEVFYRAGEDIEDDDVWIRFSERQLIDDDSEVLERGVGAVNGTVVRKPEGVSLIYDCNGYSIEIIADLNSTDEIALITNLAESMRCA